MVLCDGRRTGGEYADRFHSAWMRQHRGGLSAMHAGLEQGQRHYTHVLNFAILLLIQLAMPRFLTGGGTGRGAQGY